MLALIRFIILLAIKSFARIFYTTHVTWINVPRDEFPWDNTNIFIVLNHTSLYEPLYLGVVPNRLLWRFANYGVFPGAKETLDRPFVGFFFRLMAPKVISLSRKRDETWDKFMTYVDPRFLVFLAPEGRMRRPGGFDKHGKPLTVRGGIADMLQIMQKGKMVIAYSGGLHHVQIPGQLIPKVFKPLYLGVELIDIEDYLISFGEHVKSIELKRYITKDLDQRRDRYLNSISRI